MMTKETNTGKTTVNRLNRAALPMITITLPILMETFFRMLVASIDTVMLSGYSQEAVAGVGLMAQYVFFIHILFLVICTGTSIVLAQYLGAGRQKESTDVTQASVVMISIIALFLTILVLSIARPVLSLYQVEPQVREYAIRYLMIFGGCGAFFTAFSLLQSTILRAYGYTKDAMYITLIANAINVIGNAIAIYGPFGIPVTGVTGVAASSVISQIAACIILAYRIRIRKEVQFPLSGWKKIPREIYATILKIGVPTAGENMSYNIAQIAIMAMVSTLGTNAMSSMIYAITIARFVFIIPMSIGSAVQLKTGYLVGAKESETAYKRLYKYQALGTLIAMASLTIITIFKGSIISIFTNTPEIATITYTLLLFSYYVEFGRSLNLITISALKGAGDVKFPVFYGIFSMWCIMVLGSYLLGLRAGLGLVGIWLAIGTDETLRGVVMLFRWKSKRWMTKAIA